MIYYSLLLPSSDLAVDILLAITLPLVVVVVVLVAPVVVAMVVTFCCKMKTSHGKSLHAYLVLLHSRFLQGIIFMY